MHRLETERLILEAFRPEDIHLIHNLHSDMEVVRYLGFKNLPTQEENQGWLDRTLKAYQIDGLGQLAVYLKPDREFIGRCGTRIVEIETEPGDSVPEWFWYRGSAPEDIAVSHHVEIGYAFAAAHWGKGYATEAVRACCRHIFENKIDDSVVAVTFPENIPSARVLSKAGFEQTGKATGMGFNLITHVLVKPDGIS